MNQTLLPVVGLAALQEVVDHDVAYEAVRSALYAIVSGEIDVTEELALKLRNSGEIHIKGGWLVSQPYVVFKVAAGGFPHGTNSGCSILLDARTGAPTMVFDDGGWLTEMRTAAAGALTADLLAVDGELVVAILGTGVQARYQLDALRHRRAVREVRVWGRDADKTKQFASQVDARPCASIAEAVADADLIVTTTSATEPILFAAHLRPGVHVTAMGADIRGKRELASDVFSRADIIAVDDRANCARVGELQHVPQAVAGAIELATLITASSADRLRRSRTDITVADLCGLGAYDAAIASAAHAALGR